VSSLRAARVVILALGATWACQRKPPPGDSKSLAARTATAMAASQTPVANGHPAVDAQAASHPIDTGRVRVEPPWLSLETSGSDRPPDWTAEALEKRVPATDGPRFYATNRHVWIYPAPDLSLQWIGFLWTGGSVRLRSTRPIYGEGCSFFYAILPRGYICTDGNKGTLDPNDKLYRQLLRYSPRTDSPFLHRYGQVRALTRYFDFPITNASLGTDAGAGDTADDVLPFAKLPPSIHEAHTSLIDRSTVAYTAEIQHRGQDFLLTSDYALVAKEKVTAYPNTSFHGVVLNAPIRLPLAFIRGSDRPRYAMAATNHFEPSGKPHARLSWVQLTGQKRRAEDAEWLETTDGGWLKASDATVPTPSAVTPWGVPVGGTEVSAATPKGRATWIEVSILGGWLIAYEGTRPVFTTLISPGSGGIPHKGQAPIDTFSTPLGRFQINGKFVSSTMIGPTRLIHSEVPYAQNFASLYAIHAAYWHDNWGYPMSGGCVNVSPIDGYHLFHWTEPEIPEGWYGVRWIPSREPSTIVIIHR
jgi:hypothetical protein